MKLNMHILSVGVTLMITNMKFYENFHRVAASLPALLPSTSGKCIWSS